MDAASALSMPVPFGVSAETGTTLPALSAGAIDNLTAEERRHASATDGAERRAAPDGVAFAVLGDVEPSDLSQAGWGVIFGASVPDSVKSALQPLLDRRKAQAGERLFKIFDGADACRNGESASQWLSRQGVSLNVVDPSLGVPFYLLLVGSPEEIPFEFQYSLDVFWAVGRVHFDSADEYAAYADSVVRYEVGAKPETSRQLALFAPAHDFDRATQMFLNKVASPLAQGTSDSPRLGTRQQFAMRSYFAGAATKQQLADIYRGRIEGGPPALLFSGSHGMAFKPDDPRLASTQGALVCQDWGGYGAISEGDWFAAADVPSDARVNGLIHVIFACYGAGCPKFDNFGRRDATPAQVAPHALVSALPRALLSHAQGGALAVIGHVERAWGYSFLSDRGAPQTQGFRDVVGRLLRGERVGQALDQFNVRWAALSTDLSDTLDAKARGAAVSDAELANKWVARDDARNYVVFGDPAVRLRVEEMPVIAEIP